MARTCQYVGICPRDVFGTDKITKKGYCKNHQWCRTDLKQTLGNKTKTAIKRPSPFKDKPAGDEQDLWFQERRKEMTGRCVNCGQSTVKDDPLMYKCSVSHILPKKDNFGGFPSVKTHPMNYIELCFWGNSCHTNFDNKGWDYAKTMKCWPLIVERFKQIYPFIAESEKYRIPQQLIDTL